ncbi:ADP-ribosylglycohydrolase family protein [Tuwongella immobilis]|uniref:Uncharacterized protein n=1 Tax=Tuwongella immobilis TaxID=692036 RepID=A0A6C2YTX8_9BACT|nr:ADP-ribosylglycohydrolase family protein [Tuwongella immobilis]VIP04807.1 adp-ribosylation crystallin j1 : ADP-ribosylation/Crystallin J1 OS=Rhodopirellula sallentina SM41 GN=RSSM_02403 PE=4 SV=1: ADP_ribosyl_GH [Tuwongella immobilis]VTS06974.1 adp-ribosylation crystallin j1 : ADP-ribosylation/Crystallin J1 OS=Rhodopirellula sallentina SM41 GN=RSSM_02403 PE=4 SV=1: ADP_ribosyl_GH [Tuwongella immobilis]
MSVPDSHASPIPPTASVAVTGAILGTAVGDALGLPYEGISWQRAAKLLGPPDRHRFWFGRGMTSDDTEHTCMVVQAYLQSGGNLDAFERNFARRLRFWLLALPAGIGKATLQAILKLWLGWKPGRNGVFSAGNGPAMRAAVIGAMIPDPIQRQAVVARSSRLTHTDPLAEIAAQAVALAAAMSAAGTVSPNGDSPQLPSGEAFLAELRRMAVDPAAWKFLPTIEHAVQSAAAGESAPTFAESLGCARGVSGYVLHTVPVVIQVWLRFPRDFAQAIPEIIRCGGDADTTAAILGGIIGAGVGVDGIPESWRSGLMEWPRSVQWMQRLGRTSAPPVPEVALAAVLLRNLGFLGIVLLHILRRMLPPYR